MSKTFDLVAFATSISSLYLRMQVLSSLAWRVDTLIVQQCRGLFKTLKLTPLALTLDGDADFRNAITEGHWTEQLFGEAGADTMRPMQTLQTLACMRLAVHELAQDATMLVPWSTGQQRRYEVPEIEAIFQPAGGTEPRGESLLRMQMSAERNAARMANGADAKELAKRFLAARVRIEKANLTSMQHNMANQTDSLIAIYSYTMAQIDDSVTGDYTSLHTDVQRTLIDSVINSVERAVQQAESQPKEVPFDDFCQLLVVADEAKAQLKAVLASPSFNGNPVTRVTKLTSPAAPTKADAQSKVEVKRKDQIESQLDPVKAAKKVIAKHKATTMKAKVEKAATKTPPVTAIGQALAAAAVTDTAPNDL